jgi:hypothetical protein
MLHGCMLHATVSMAVRALAAPSTMGRFREEEKGRFAVPPASFFHEFFLH